ncbi:MAG: choice-of-anchor J domain-containing protein [Bacteroidota bacterium]
MRKLVTMITTIVLLGWYSNAHAQAFTFAAGQLNYTENFDGMGPTGTAFLNGWTAIRYAGTGAAGATLTMVVTDGSANSGAIYNVGTVAATDRAFGSLASGSTVPRFGASFLNSTGGSITSIDLTGVMEQWRSGSSATVNEVTAFEYSLDATDLSSGTWVAVTSFDLVEKIIASAAAAALDGNLPENQTALTASITGINWTPNSNLWIRWSDVNDLGSDGICAIDNMSMTVSTGSVTPDPEPTNYPTTFAAASAGTTIKATWTDAVGAQLPAGYLVKISTSANITAPVDGTYTSDDLDLTDGSGAKNVAFGQQTFTFSGLAEGTAYTLKIFPYTNGGTLVNYKTDGTVPSAAATTQNIMLYTNFDTDLAPWTQFSLTGDQVWTEDLTHGLNSSGCAKMSGFLVTNFVNEDWLISPAIDFSNTSSTKFQFYSAYNYAGNPLTVLVSTDYASGDPTASGTWTDISSSAVFSPGGWAWTPSGFINLGISNVSNVHVAFKYTSDLTAARTWEIDEVVFAGVHSVGIAENGTSNNSTRIYPNPCNGWFNAEMPDNGNFSISISNAQGLLVKSITSASKLMKIETTGLSTGLYFVTVHNTASGLNEVHKLLVK